MFSTPTLSPLVELVDTKCLGVMTDKFVFDSAIQYNE